jgi:hypothetical protein
MFDMLDIAGNNLEVFERWTTDLEEWLPQWNQAAEVVSGTLPSGWRPVFSLRHFQQHVEDREPIRMLRTDYQAALALQLAGVPITGFSTETDGHLLSAEASKGMSKEELTALLEKPLIMDGGAAQRFLDLGMGAKIGLKSLTTYQEGAYEVFTDHAVNGSGAGYQRVMTMKYFGLCSHALEPEPGTDSLSTLVAYSGKDLGSALTLYRPVDAPPVAILGHAPWMHIVSPQRMEQMRRLADAMAPGSPSISSCDRAVVLWNRRGLNGKKMVALFNPGFDSATVTLAGGSRLEPVLASPEVVLKAPNEVCLPGWAYALFSLNAS